MASSRGAANAALYRARTLLSAWSHARERQSAPDEHLTETFLPGVREHLTQAYGCFLLAAAGIDDMSGRRPPRSTQDVPAVEPGKALPPELREFQLLEEEGWVGEMLTLVESGSAGGAVASGPDLLGTDRTGPGYAVAQRWAERLTSTMQRMDDFLAEC